MTRDKLNDIIANWTPEDKEAAAAVAEAAFYCASVDKAGRVVEMALNMELNPAVGVDLLNAIYPGAIPAPAADPEPRR